MARKSRYDLPKKAVLYIPPRAAEQAGLYLRLSVEDGDDLENNSIGNQKKICLDYLQQHPDIEMKKTYIDNGKTGMNYNRQGFQEMFQDLKDGIINCVIVKDISRLGRHYLMTSEYVMNIFPKMNVRLICINDAFDSNDKNSDKESLLMPFKLLMNDTYVRDTSKKIRSSIHAKMERGEFLPSAGSIPYGYVRNPEENTFDIDKETAQTVKSIFEMRATGMKFNAIANALNAEGILSPGRLRLERGITKAKKYQNAIWIRGTIRKITSDPVYLGRRIHGRIKKDRLDLPKTNRTPAEWQTIENAHPAIVSEELFDAVQEVNQVELENRSQYGSSEAPSVDFRETFRDVLFCGDCMSSMSGQKVTQRAESNLPNTVAFNCRRYTYSNRKECCNHHIRQEKVMESVRNFLDKQVEIAVDLEQFLEELQKNPEVTQHQKELTGRLEHIRRRHVNSQAKIERLIRDMTEGLLERDEYKHLKERYSEEEAQLAQMETDASRDVDALQNILDGSQKWIALVKETGKLPTLDQAAVNDLFAQILVFKDRSLHITAKFSDPYAPVLAYLKDMREVNDNAG